MKGLPKDLITPAEAAKMLGCTTHSIYRAMRDGRLRGYHKLSRRYYVSRADVEAAAGLVQVEPPFVPPWKR